MALKHILSGSVTEAVLCGGISLKSVDSRGSRLANDYFAPVPCPAVMTAMALPGFYCIFSSPDQFLLEGF